MLISPPLPTYSNTEGCRRCCLQPPQRALQSTCLASVTLSSTLTQDRVERNPNPAPSAGGMHSSYPSPLIDTSLCAFTMLCYVHSRRRGSSGLKVSNPTTKNSLPPSDLLLYLQSLIMTLSTRACYSQSAVLYSRAKDKQLQMTTLINQASIQQQGRHTSLLVCVCDVRRHFQGREEQESMAHNRSCPRHGTQHTWSEQTQVPSQSKPSH